MFLYEYVVDGLHSRAFKPLTGAGEHTDTPVGDSSEDELAGHSKHQSICVPKGKEAERVPLGTMSRNSLNHSLGVPPDLC